jgi:hypothetical protein
MADAIQTLPNSKNDLIISLVQKELIEKAMLAPFCRDLSGFATKGTKSIAVPKLSSFSVSNRGFGAAGDATALTDSKDTINLDFNAYLAWVEDHADIYQSTIEYRMEASKRAATAHAKYVDQQIVAGLIAVAGLSLGSVADITKTDILDMREQIVASNGDLTQAVLIMAPDQEKAMLQIADFMEADKYGSSNIPNGMIGRVYGVPVVISNLIPAGQAIMFEKDGFGVAFQQGVNMSEQDANEFGAEGKRVAVDQVFGVGGLELGEQGAGAALSPLVVTLA